MSSRVLFTDEIPDPRDIIVICLVNACDVFRFMFDIDEETQERIDLICRMDLIGRSIAAAVEHSISSPSLRPSALTRKIPVIPLRKVLSNPRLRGGNIARIFAHLAEEHGPVFQIRLPFQERATYLAGAEANRWIHRNGRMYLRSRDYFTEMEKVYGASGLIPSLDGAPHFRLRKAMQPGTSRARLEDRLHDLYRHARAFMAGWKVGASLPATGMSRLMINAQVSPLTLGIESQDFVEDLIRFKERALTTHVARMLPKFMLRTPSMKRASRAIDVGVRRTLGVHTSAQRAGCPRDLADDLLSLHSSDPQFLPESNLGFALSTPLLASMYLGDALGFALYVHGVAARALRQDPERSRHPVRERRPGRRGFRRRVHRRHAPLHHGVSAHVPHRARVRSQRDELVRGRGLRATPGGARRHRPDGGALHERRLPRPRFVRHRPLSAAAQ